MWHGNDKKHLLQKEKNIFIHHGGSFNDANDLIQKANNIKEQLQIIKNQIRNGQLTCDPDNFPNDATIDTATSTF